MASPVNDTYSTVSGGDIYAGAIDPSPVVRALTFAIADSGVVNTNITGSIVNTGTQSEAWSITPPANMTVTPSSGTLAAGATQVLAVQASVAATYSGITLVCATASITGNTQNIVVSAAVATVATITLASTGITGSPTTGTVSLNGPAPAAGSITLAGGSGVTFTSGAPTWTLGESGAAKSFTVQYSADGVHSVSGTSSIAGVTMAGAVSHTTAAAVAGGTMAAFTLTSVTSGSLPFSIGYPIRQGDVPTGSAITLPGATARANILNTWPDGSAKFALISGVYTSAGSAVSITPTVGSVSEGAALTGASVQSAMGSNTAVIDCGAFGTVTFSGADFATPFKTHSACDYFGEFIYRKAVGSDPTLTAWIAVRLCYTGQIEVLPWVENGWMTGADPANKSATYTFALGGTTRFSGVVDVKHHTRVPLLSGGLLSHWLGADPGVTVAHNSAYLMSTKLVPNYGWGAPSAGTLNALLQTYTPNTLAGVNTLMGTAGASAALINSTQAYYITSGGDVRAWKAAQVFGYSGGSWSTHLRDASTNQLPRFQDYPAASLQGGTPSIAGGTGGENGTAVTTHQPGFGYLPYLMTGRYWFFEEHAFWATFNHFDASDQLRRGWTAYATAPYLFADGRYGVIDPRAGPYSNRGAHWSIRILAQTLAITPPGHPCLADYVTAWESNAAFYAATFVNGTHAPGWVSPQGFLGEYSSSGDSLYGTHGSSVAWWGAAWMSTFGGQAWGFASNLGLPVSTTAAANAIAVRTQAYKQVVQRAGDGVSYNWRRFAVYDYPLGTDGVGLPPETWFTAAQSYTDYVSSMGLASIAATAGLTLKDHSSDTDLAPGSTTSTDYGPFALSALAYAVDHGAPGAAAGWARVSGASNFASGFAGLSEDPAHAITPLALPSFVPPPGFFADLPASSNATMNSVRPTGWPTSEEKGPFRNWSTAKYLPDVGEYGALVIYGSGHLSPGETLYAGMFVRPLDGTSGWEVRTSHAAMLEYGVPGATFGSYFDSTQTGSVGWPYPGHQYTGVIVQPEACGGTPGWGSVYSVMLGGWGLGGAKAAYKFDLSTPSVPPVRVIDAMDIAGSGNSYPACIEDFQRGGWWTLNYNGNGPLVFTDFATHTQTDYSGATFNDDKDYQLALAPELGCLIAAGGSAAGTGYHIRVSVMTAGVPAAFVDVALSGTTPPNALAGIEWCPLLGKFASYEGTVNATTTVPPEAYIIHWLTPPSDLTGGTWVWSQETLAPQGGATIYHVYNPDSGFVLIYGTRPYSKFRWVPKLKSFVFGEGLDGPVKLWRPAAAV